MIGALFRPRPRDHDHIVRERITAVDPSYRGFAGHNIARENAYRVAWQLAHAL